MTKAKFDDIVGTMIEIGILNPVRALRDANYFNEQFWAYVDAENIVRGWFNLEPIL